MKTTKRTSFLDIQLKRHFFEALIAFFFLQLTSGSADAQMTGPANGVTAEATEEDHLPRCSFGVQYLKNGISSMEQMNGAGGFAQVYMFTAQENRSPSAQTVNGCSEWCTTKANQDRTAERQRAIQNYPNRPRKEPGDPEQLHTERLICSLQYIYDPKQNVTIFDRFSPM